MYFRSVRGPLLPWGSGSRPAPLATAQLWVILKYMEIHQNSPTPPQNREINQATEKSDTPWAYGKYTRPPCAHGAFWLLAMALMRHLRRWSRAPRARRGSTSGPPGASSTTPPPRPGRECTPGREGPGGSPSESLPETGGHSRAGAAGWEPLPFLSSSLLSLSLLPLPLLSLSLPLLDIDLFSTFFFFFFFFFLSFLSFELFFFLSCSGWRAKWSESKNVKESRGQGEKSRQ